MFDPRDLKDIQELGIDQAQVMAQIQVFEQGVPALDILRPATIGDGIMDCSMDQWRHWARIFEQQSKALEVVKFVPASGAASRMFKDLFSFLETDGDLEKNKFVEEKIKENFDLSPRGIREHLKLKPILPSCLGKTMVTSND